MKTKNSLGAVPFIIDLASPEFTPKLDAPYISPAYQQFLDAQSRDGIPGSAPIAEVTVSGTRWPWPWILGGALILGYVLLSNKK